MSASEKLKLLITMCLNVAILTWLVSWRFALTLTLGVLIHEYGHYWMMCRQGLPASMIFIPALGAIATAKKFPDSLYSEFKISLAGPIFGLIPVFISLIGLFATNNMAFAAAAAIICIFNLFNVAQPLGVLDSGRALRTIIVSINRNLETWFYIFSLAAMVFLAFYLKAFLIYALLFYFTLREFINYLECKKELYQLMQIATRSKIAYLAGISKLPSNSFASKVLVKDVDYLDKKVEACKRICEQPQMTTSEICYCLVVWVPTVFVYIIILTSMVRILNNPSAKALYDLLL